MKPQWHITSHLTGVSIDPNGISHMGRWYLEATYQERLDYGLINILPMKSLLLMTTSSLSPSQPHKSHQENQLTLSSFAVAFHPSLEVPGRSQSSDQCPKASDVAADWESRLENEWGWENLHEDNKIQWGRADAHVFYYSVRRPFGNCKPPNKERWCLIGLSLIQVSFCLTVSALV